MKTRTTSGRTLNIATVAMMLLLSPVVWAQGPQLHVVARGGTQAPGLPEGTLFNTRSFQRQSINAGGQVVFKSVVSGGKDVIYLWRPRLLRLVAVEDMLAPGTVDGTFCSFDMSNPQPSLIVASNGVVAFAAKILTPDQVDNCASLGKVGIWISGPDGLELLALEGQPAADSAPGVIYSDIRPRLPNVSFWPGCAPMKMSTRRRFSRSRDRR